MDIMKENKILDLIIIGAGPAGLSAAIYAKRARLDVLVLEAAPMSGGQVLNTYEVDNYPGLPGIAGFELGMKMREHTDKLEVTFVEGEVTELIPPRNEEKAHKVVTFRGSYLARAVILAMGAVHAKLKVHGEERLSGMGVSYCATCDGAFFKGKDVAVVGGGDVALEDAIFLSRLCNKVVLIHRRNELRGAKILQEEIVRNPKIEIIWDSTVEKIIGEEKVSALEIRNIKTGERSSRELSGVFVAVGIRPNTDIVPAAVVRDEGGYVLAGEDGKTAVPGMFAAGDLRKKPLRQVVTAVADGANAVAAVLEYIK